MHKIVVLYNRPKDPAHFREYYVTKHLPLAATFPGLKASRHSFEIASLGSEAPYFAIWEGEFADAAAAQAALMSEIGQRVAADTANYADGGLTILHFTAVEE